MAKVVLVGYGQMLNSLIEGILETKENEILGVFRTDRIKYSKFTLFFKDIFAPSFDYTNIKYYKLYDIKGESVNGEEFQKEIKRLKPDVIIVGSWAEKFKKETLSLAPVVNFHPSLLPKNRGANPYFWTIFNNQKVTGLSVHFMDERFDGGDIILQEAITIEDKENGQNLKDKTTKLARGLVQDFLDLFNKKQIQPIKQNENFASYESQIKFKDTVLNLKNPKEQVERHIRALYPWASPKVLVGKKYCSFSKFEFLKPDEKYKNKEIGSVVDFSSHWGVMKGSDFLIKIYFV